MSHFVGIRYSPFIISFMDKSKTILLTGATGFIGAYLLRQLVKEGYTDVRAIRRSGSPMVLVEDIKKEVDWREGDLLDLPALDEAMKGVAKVIHCAGLVSFNAGDYARLKSVNQTGTANVVNLALEEGVEKLIHISSIAAIGRTKNEPNINEDTKWQDGKWNNPYGISKHLAEMEVWRGIAEGLPAAIVNPANVLGSGFWKDRMGTGQFFYKVWKGLPFYPLGGTGFVDVRDVARFTVQLMESDIVEQRYILSGENLPFKWVFDEIAKALGVRAPYIAVNPFIRETAWRATWLLSKITGKAPFITKETARSSARTFFYDNQKSLAAFPFTYTPIRQTIQETGAQFLGELGN